MLQEEKLFEVKVKHLAGFFELSSNRRDIWHGEGMAGIGQLRCDYNMALLKVSSYHFFAVVLSFSARVCRPTIALHKHHTELNLSVCC